MAVLEPRFMWVSFTALGVPVVPPVCSSVATSLTSGRAVSAGRAGLEATRRSQEPIQLGTGARISSRLARAALTGRRRAACRWRGNAEVMLTA